jgi:hypothetical protein
MNNRLKNILIAGMLLLPNLIHAASFKHHGSPKDPKMLLVMLAFCGVVLLVAVGYLSLCLVFSVIKPDLLRRSGEFLKGAVLKNLLTGLLVSVGYIFLLGLIAQLIPRGALRILLAAPIVSVLFVHGLVGFTMIAQALGDKIHSNINSRYIGSTFMAVLAGGSVLILTGLIPFVGPVCFLVVNLTGMGLALRTVIALRKNKNDN